MNCPDESVIGFGANDGSVRVWKPDYDGGGKMR